MEVLSAKSGISRQIQLWLARYVGKAKVAQLHGVSSANNNEQVIHVEAKKEMRKRIVRELQIMHGCHSEYIVTFYGAFLNEHNDVIMCMEYMDVGYVAF